MHKARNTTILVVDDEENIREFIRKNLEVRGYDVIAATNGEDALALFESHPVDLVILDIMMPILDGLATTRRIRQISMVPIIVLTAIGNERDKITAFNLGADDYLTKPFGVGELLARIRAVLRRARWAPPPAQQTGELIIGEISVNLDTRSVSVRNENISLTPTEYNLLVYLMMNAGKPIKHETLLQHVWGPEYGQETEYLRVYIGHLRQKLERDPSNPQYILTERGIGYRFASDEN